MALSYNLGYQESISVHPTRRQNFAGKPYLNFPNIWEWLINVTNYSKSPTKSKLKYSSEYTRKIRTSKRKTSCSCICFRHTWGFSAVTFVRTQCERNVALWHWKIHLFLLFLYKHRFVQGFMKMSKMEYERSQTVTTTLKRFRLWLYISSFYHTCWFSLAACLQRQVDTSLKEQSWR